MSEFTSRYGPFGSPEPDPATMCKGQCEGLGYYPVEKASRLPLSPEEMRLWQEAHDAPDAHNNGTVECDGWHFITCPDCGGTGKRKRDGTT